MATTYTVCIVDTSGHIEKYIRPNFTDPAKALAKLRTEKAHRKGARIAVMCLDVRMLDEDALEQEINRLSIDD